MSMCIYEYVYVYVNIQCYNLIVITYYLSIDTYMYIKHIML